MPVMTANGNIQSKRTLKGAMAIHEFRSFKAETVEDYIKRLKGLNLIDLCAHAAKYGLNPNVDRKRVERDLVNAYKKAKMSFDLASGNYQEVTPVPEDKQERLKQRLDFIRNS